MRIFSKTIKREKEDEYATRVRDFSCFCYWNPADSWYLVPTLEMETYHFCLSFYFLKFVFTIGIFESVDYE